jgi:drug/metabolite transporter (DMT)-like permease
MGSVQRPFFLCFLQAAMAACVAGVCCLLTKNPPDSTLSTVLVPLLYAGVISGGVGFTLQAISQRHTPPAEASLIMSLESVFAALAGAVLLGERLSLVATVGCGLILLAVLIVEVLPASGGVE